MTNPSTQSDTHLKLGNHLLRRLKKSSSTATTAGTPYEQQQLPDNLQAYSSEQQDGSQDPPSATVPPLRSMSIKHGPKFNSTATLRADTAVPCIKTEPTDALPPTASGISRSIQTLEALLHEALHIARTATEDEEADETPIQIEPVKPRRPSEQIKARASHFVEHLPPIEQDADALARPLDPPRLSFLEQNSNLQKNKTQKHTHAEDALRACEAIHGEIKELKAALAPPAITVNDDSWDPQVLSARHKSLPSLSENREPLLPAPVVVGLRYPRGQSSRQTISNAALPTRKEVKKHIKANNEPPITPRTTSSKQHTTIHEEVPSPAHISSEGRNTDSSPEAPSGPDLAPLPGYDEHFSKVFGVSSKDVSIKLAHDSKKSSGIVDLRRKRHVDLKRELRDFPLHETCGHKPVARDWPRSRKRFAAAIACLNTACIGIIIGIYAGEVPAIQYVIVDFDHYTILGNVWLYLGLAIPTLFLWPLPLLHGRKPYTVAALAVALCLQIPQGIAVGAYRSPYVTTYRILLLLSRAVSGFALGFANMNLQATLLDLFGASLMAGNPHGEKVDENDVRRHGGGMGVWLAIYSWCTMGSISIGFLIGACLIVLANVTWGFWVSLLLLMFVLLINVISPELRRSAFRRTMAEIRGEKGDSFHRVGRGEIKMHLHATGPYWWGEEVKAGVEMAWLMVKQPGFLILAVYSAWVYAQFTMILMLLGALASTYYMLLPQYVGLCALSLGLGALLATPFEKASLLSRARHHRQRSDSMTLMPGFVLTSHLLRRSMFTILLPMAALAYTLTSCGPPMSIGVPCFFAAIAGFLSNLAIAECYGLIMETFDTSDLQPGMTGRPLRYPEDDKLRAQRTNFSCYPRVSAGMAVTQSLEFIFGAVATGICGRVERRLGTMRASAIVAGVLLGLTLLLTIILWRSRRVTMIPDLTAPSHDRRPRGWKPVILGHPSGTTRKISILEAGRQSRWSEIRRKNRLNTGLSEID